MTTKLCKSVSAMPFILASFLTIGMNNANASIITINPQLPPTQCVGAGGGVGFCVYKADLTAIHALWNTPLGQLILTNSIHSGFLPTTPPVVVGPDEIEHFNSTVATDVSLNGNPPISVQMHGPVTTEVYGKAGQVTGSFDTEMLSMDLFGLTPFGTMLIRESPTLASTGHTDITDIGGGQYKIDSFFDIFLDLSLDGGQIWLPANGSVHVDLACIPIPAALWLFGSSLAGMGFFAKRKQRASNSLILAA